MPSSQNVPMPLCLVLKEFFSFAHNVWIGVPYQHITDLKRCLDLKQEIGKKFLTPHWNKSSHICSGMDSYIVNLQQRHDIRSKLSYSLWSVLDISHRNCSIVMHLLLVWKFTPVWGNGSNGTSVPFWCRDSIEKQHRIKELEDFWEKKKPHFCWLQTYLCFSQVLRRPDVWTNSCLSRWLLWGCGCSNITHWPPTAI